MLLAVATLAGGAHRARAADPAPIRIGLLLDLTGPYSDLQGRGSLVAAEMAVKDFGGKVLGRPIEIVSANHQLKPEVALTIVRRWFDQEGVTLIADSAGSPTSLAIQALGTEKKRITVNSTGATELLTNEQCSPYGIHWAYDSYANGKVTASIYATPGSTWYFMTVDNAGGIALQDALSVFLKERGAKIVGASRFPLATPDLSSFLLQAAVSGAQYVAFTNSGEDLMNVLKQANEFGLTKSGTTLVGEAMYISDVQAIGLESANQIAYATGFASDSTPEAAAWTTRFVALHKKMPTDPQAAAYSTVTHYLKAVQAAGTDDADAVIAKMRETPVRDIYTVAGTLRKDGRMVHEMYVVRAKKASESKGPTDLVEIVRRVSGEDAFRPLADSSCPLVRGAAAK